MSRGYFISQSIEGMFAEVPQNYEFLNHFLTFGQDILWRRKAARTAARAGGTLWLDACGGTGEMAAYLSRLAKDRTRIVMADLSTPMMEKALRKPEARRMTFASADVGYLPFQDKSFDTVTISFATRNISATKDNLLKCLRGFYRVLKPGGRFISLETSQPKPLPIRWMFHFYVKLTVAPLGRLVSGSNIAYTYLRNSMCNFYSPEELAEIIEQAGFSEVTFERLLLGAAAIHQAVK